MAQKVYTVEGRQFRTESDYARAKRDKEMIDKLRAGTNFKDKKDLETLRDNLQGGKYKFLTLLGQDFREEVETQLKIVTAGKKGKSAKKVISDENTKSSKSAGNSRGTKTGGGTVSNGSAKSGRSAVNSGDTKTGGSAGNGRNIKTGNSGGLKSGRSAVNSRNIKPARQQASGDDVEQNLVTDAVVEELLLRRERLRKWILRVCSVVAVLCLGYFSVYSYYNYKAESAFRELNDMKEDPGGIAAGAASSAGPLYTLDDAPADKVVLDEYKKLLNSNKRLIGWIKIDDTNINYPVLQTENNEYYLDHNVNEEYDINGSIFMDKDCDVIKPSTNYILYGHHMKNGKMFGKLDLYQKESYYKEHPYISFDTIYEKGTYEVMYVFRSRVYKESEIVFKYYQFIDANGEQEFDSYMQEMAAMSLYDTGVTATYGDQLLTLSTCDYQETDGRFVVVAKKIAKE